MGRGSDGSIFEWLSRWSSRSKSFTQNIEEWGNHEDLWCRKTCISRFISGYLRPCVSGSGPNQISFKRQFHNVPFSYFTNQGHGTGYYREDTGVNVIIIASDKKEYHHLWPKRIPLYRKTSKICTKSVSVLRCNAKRVILQMPLLCVWPFLMLLLFWITVSPHLRDRPDGWSIEW